jgi:phosphatidylcholine synthase
VWGFLTLLAIWDGNIKIAVIYMAMAMFVDGIDGIFARWFDTKNYAAWIDGGLMDNILDYINYVLVAALLLVKVPGLMPQGYELAAAISILLTSAFQFSQTEAKTDNKSYFFKGFPSLWNFLVLYIMLLGFNPWLNLLAVIVFDILIFVPIKFIYPTRTVRLRTLTLVLSAIFFAMGVWGLILYPDVPQWVIYGSLLYVIYYFGLSLFPGIGTEKST